MPRPSVGVPQHPMSCWGYARTSLAQWHAADNAAHEGGSRLQIHRSALAAVNTFCRLPALAPFSIFISGHSWGMPSHQHPTQACPTQRQCKQPHTSFCASWSSEGLHMLHLLKCMLQRSAPCFSGALIGATPGCRRPCCMFQLQRRCNIPPRFAACQESYIKTVHMVLDTACIHAALHGCRWTCCAWKGAPA